MTIKQKDNPALSATRRIVYADPDTAVPTPCRGGIVGRTWKSATL